jgi:hypothetical protein
MHKQKAILKEEIEREIRIRKKLLQTLEELPIDLFCEAFPSGSWGTSWGYDFIFNLPFDFALVDAVKEFMALQFPDHKKVHESRIVWDASKEAGHFLDYEIEDRRGSRLKFSFRTGKEGTTCVLNKIGEKSTPVYEVVCGEGAAEAL